MLMQIPSMPDYNGILFSGCTIELANQIEDGRMYGPVYSYGTTCISPMAVFDFVVIDGNCKISNWPLSNPLQHLSMEYFLNEWEIDYLSFTSLN